MIRLNGASLRLYNGARKVVGRSFKWKTRAHRLEYWLASRHPFRDQRKLLHGRDEVTIFDVGAHVGGAAAMYRSVFPNATVHSFEPTPESFRELSRNLGGDPRVRASNVAVGDAEGSCSFNIFRNSQVNSLFPFTDTCRSWYYADAEPVCQISLPVTTIDRYRQENDISRVHVLKLDTQGAELQALTGAEEALREHLVDLIFCELLFVPYYKGGAMFYEVCSHLSERGYSLFNLYNLQPGTAGQLTWGDAIFVSPELRESAIETNGC